MADSVKIKITGDDKEFRSTLSGIGQKANGIFKGIMAAQIVTKGVSLLTSGLKSAINTGMQFEAAMSQVAAISGATDSELEKLTETAKHYGETTVFSASQAAEALNYMALAGWDAQQSIDALGGVLDLAAASGMDLGAASDAVTDYLSAFGMEASQAGYMADLMAYAQSNANTTASALADAYGNCASSMHAAGQDIETTTAFLMALANQGIKGSEAGTQMAAVMRDMTQKMKNGKIMIGQTAVAVTDAAGNFRDLNDIMADVSAATDGMGSAERSAALLSTFSARSIKAVNTILNEGMDSVSEYEKALRDSGGTAAEQAEKMLDNLQGDIKIFQSALEGLQITASESTNGIARSIVQEGTSILEAINQGGKTGGLSGMFDAALAQIPKLLPKVTDGAKKLLQGLGKNLPGMIKSVMGSIPGMLDSVVELAPDLADSLFEGASAAVESSIGMLPQLVPKLLKGILNLGESIVSGVGTLFKRSLYSLLGYTENKYESFGPISAELTYDVDTDANIDISGAEAAATQAWNDFKDELKGYGLTTEQIAKILTFTGNEAELEEYLKTNFPNLDEAARNAIKAKFTPLNDGKSLADIFDQTTSPQLTAADVGMILLGTDLSEEGIRSYLDDHFPNMDDAMKNVIIDKFKKGGEAGFGSMFADLVETSRSFGLTADDIGSILLDTDLTEDSIREYLDAHFPNLDNAAKNIIISKFTKGGADGLASLFSDATSGTPYGLTAKDIAEIIVSTDCDAASIEKYLNEHFPDLDAVTKAAVRKALVGENGTSIGANLKTELSGLGITNEDIIAIITAQAEGDTTTVQKLLEDKYANVKQEAYDALSNAWNNSTASFNTGESNLSFGAQLIVEMFTNGKDEDEEAVQSALQTARDTIERKRAELMEYINGGGEDQEGAQKAVSLLDQYDAALVNYASNYANASTEVCKQQGEALLTMCQQAQDAVDAINLQTQRMISIQERIYNLGTGGAKLSNEDYAQALGFVAATYKQDKEALDTAREEALKNAKTAEDYARIQDQYDEALQSIMNHRQAMIADLIRGQAGNDIEGLDVAAALTGVWDKIEAAAKEAGKYTQSDIEQILRDAGYGDDLIGKAIEAIFGQQQYNIEGDIGRKVGDLDVGNEIKASLMAYFNSGNLTPETIASTLTGTQWENMIPEIISQLLTPENMSDDNVNLDHIVGNMDFGQLGSILLTSIEAGMFDGMQIDETLDINKQILSLLGDTSLDSESLGKDVKEQTKTIGKFLPEGMVEGMSDTSGVETAGKAIGKAGVDSVAIGAYTQSPSTATKETGENVVAGLVEGMSDTSTVEAAGKAVGAAAVNAVNSSATGTSSAGYKLAEGMASGIRSGRSMVISAAIEVANAAAQAVRAALGIHSPSRVAIGFGQMFDKGFAVGIDKETGSVVRSAVGMVNSVVGAANLTPKMDLSGMTSSMKGAIGDIADIESSREIALYVNGYDLARATDDDYNAALNGYAKRISMGYGRG